MSIASSGDVFASAAGSHLAQTTGVDVQRIQQHMANHQRQIASDRQADNAAGIAETDGQDHETHQRDADGRRPWEIGPPKRAIVPGEESSSAPIPSHDAREHCGQSLDLTA
jgi:pyruvate/2-oxoglutarate dehydrogenase complex dihydrolipoamide acyltransferase (E2) component